MPISNARISLVERVLAEVRKQREYTGIPKSMIRRPGQPVCVLYKSSTTMMNKFVQVVRSTDHATRQNVRVQVGETRDERGSCPVSLDVAQSGPGELG
jgi:hypothetical protein